MTHDDAPEPVHDASGDVTRLLAEVGRRDDAWSDLLALVYDELRALAARRMAHERVEHTLQATALVHEAVLRLIGDRGSDWTGRRHFFGAAAEAMRRVLVDHARKVRAARRGGERARLSLTLVDLPGDADPERVLALDEALTTLEGEDARAAEVARLRWFAGLSVAETALALEVSERTVMREWTFARARLSELLGDTSSE
ncbi:MAG: sigma-70 family RNA polymerase sigma factor [Planctomycetes bacterium]|nr:sigma-70 family RNA polymerase sigma factor [Planctomycetota bacterium]